MSAPLSEQQLAEISGRVDGLDRDRIFKGGAWKSSPVDAKSVLPPQTNFAVEEVLKTGDCVIRASVAVFADEKLADFTAAAREDVPALLAEVERLKAELATARAAALNEGADLLVAYCPDHGSKDTCTMSCHCGGADELRTLATQGGAR